MLTVGDKFPTFSLVASPAKNHHDFVTIDNQTYNNKWLMIFFWPKDFTFVCPTEMIDYGNIVPELEKLNCQLLGCSVDNEFVHAAWKINDKRLESLPYPIMSDIKRELSASLGIIDKNAGVSQRATFIIDPEGVIRSLTITDLSVGRNAEESLRTLSALQTGELCPANWKKGDKFL